MTNPTARPHLIDARPGSADTYNRRRARRAADELLSIATSVWDDHTLRVILVTLPSLIYANLLARYGEPQCTCDGRSLMGCLVHHGNEAMGIGALHSRTFDESDPLLIPPYRTDGSLQACTVEIAGDVMCGEAQPCAEHPPIVADPRIGKVI